MEKEINKALSELYTSLEQLQSARKQVEIVTDSSTTLSGAIEKLLQEIQKYSNELNDSNAIRNEHLDSLLKNFERKLKDISIERNNELSVFAKNFDSQLKNLIKSAKSQLNADKISFESLYESNNSKLKEILDQFNRNTNSLKELTERSILEVKDLSVSELSSQNKKIGQTISHIQSLLEQIGFLVSYLQQSEISENLDKLKHKIDTQNKGITRLLYVIIAIMSGGGLLIVLKTIFNILA